jgi:hypothetical protein
VAEVGCRQDIVPVVELVCRQDIVPGSGSAEDAGERVVAVVDDLAVEGDDEDLLGADLDDRGDVLVGLVLGDGDALAEQLDADGAPGNLRADYVLPRKNLRIVDSAVFWPIQASPLFPLTGVFPFPSSDHRAVWIDVRVPG